MQGKCETCRWWGQERESDYYQQWGSCRVKNPTVGTVQLRLSCDPLAGQNPSWPYRAGWPWTASDDWCGEYQKKDTPDA